MIKLTYNNREIFIEGKTIGLVDYVYRDEDITLFLTYPSLVGTDNTSYDLSINGDYYGTFLTNKKGEVFIELNYALRNIPDYTSFTLMLSNKTFTFSHSFTIRPGINRDNIISPNPIEYIQSLGPSFVASTGYETKSQIFPPNVIYSLPPYQSANNYAPIIFESTVHDWYIQKPLTDTLLTPLTSYPESYPITEKCSSLYLSYGNKQEYHIKIEELSECDEFCIVRWISQFGQLRQHIFKVKNINNSINESTDLITRTNGIKRIKNTDNSFVLSIEGITRYSLWYYQDLLLSKEIHATKVISESHYNNPNYLDSLSLDYTLVEVDGNEVEIEPGNEFFNLELTLKKKEWRRY